MKTAILIATASLSSLTATLCHAEQLYVDANFNGNTSNAETGSTTDWAVSPVDNPNGAPNGDDLWGQRTSGPAGPAFGATVWQVGSSEVAPTLVTVVTGLLPNTTYGGLRVYFSGKQATDVANEWYIAASVNGVDFVTYLDGSDNATPVDTSNNGVGTEIVPSETADIRYYASLPDGTTDGSGNLRIWVRQGEGADNRTVYDGIGYDNTPLPGGGGIAVTEFAYDPVLETASITWDSVDQAKYLVEISTDLQTWAEATDDATVAGSSTTVEIVIPDLSLPADPGSTRVYFRIRLADQ